MCKLRKYAMGLDLYERHTIISRILSKSQSKSVLDIGGQSGNLQRFSSRFIVTAINIDDTGDVRYEGEKLPYSANAFDTVVSLDVLEHIPPQRRNTFIKEMLRVAEREAIFCTPLGTPLHRDIEIKLNNAWRREFKTDHRFLKEHIEYGLPTLSAIETILSSRKCETFFTGDIRVAAYLFKNHIKFLKYRKRFIRMFFLLLISSSTLLFYYLRTTKEPSEFTNRIYVHIKDTN
jgi:SAM-dependent methyltransferase